jgi:hypothetical protein
MSLSETLRALGAFLQAHEALWRPQPFHTPRPAWYAVHPALAARLLALEEAHAEALATDNTALIDWLGAELPALREAQALVRVPVAAAVSTEAPPRLLAHVPGRKEAQVRAFCAAVGEVRAPLLEWCAGKGHLGRLLAWRHGLPVRSLEIDARLVAAGEALARRAGLAQEFVQADVLACAGHLAGRHAVALHACGELHLKLLADTVAQRAPALDVAPCCYDRIAAARYRPLAAAFSLDLAREELHLAVTDTVAAGARERRLRDQAAAWKLAFLELRAELGGVPRERPFKPVPGAWLGLDFRVWMERLAAREGLRLPARLDWAAWEQRGWARRAEVLRLDLVRLAFRRALELWLVLDRAVFLERAGYAVRVTQFCDAGITPRNLLVSARG